MAEAKHVKTRRGIKAADYNRVVDSARAGANPTAGTGLNAFAAGDTVSIAPQPMPDIYVDSVMVKHSSSDTAPLYCVVQIFGELSPLGQTNGIQLSSKPLESGISRIGITHVTSIGPDKLGYVQYRGIAHVIYTATSEVGIGTRLGVRSGSYYAQPDDGGPMRVTQRISFHIGSGIGHAEVEIIGRRLDSKIVNCDAAGGDGTAASGPYYTIIYAASAGTPIETSPGKLETS